MRAGDSRIVYRIKKKQLGVIVMAVRHRGEIDRKFNELLPLKLL